MSHSLVEIPRPQWTELRDLYISKREFASAYNLLQNFIDWATQNADIDVTIYSLDGDWREDGTFIILDFPPGLYCNTLSDNKDRLLTALNCLDTKLTHVIAGFQEHVSSTVLQHFLDTGFTKKDFNTEGTVWYHLPKEQAEQFRIDPPEGFTLSHLEARHAALVNDLWPHHSPGTEVYIARLIRYNDSVGAFDIAGNLVAWCLQLPLGAMGMLQVLDAHKRKGLGNLLVRYMSKLAASKQLEAIAPVVFKNSASRTMFEKLGFKIVDQVYWVWRPGKNDAENAELSSE